MRAEHLTRFLDGSWRGATGNAPCPRCQPERRRDQNALSIRDGDDGKLLLFCFKTGCDFADIARAAKLPQVPGEVDLDAMRQAREKRRDYEAVRLGKARACWGRGKPIAGSKAEAYLRSRGIAIPLPETLRFSRDEYHGPSGRYHCAMLADIQPTGGVHRTFLKKGGGHLIGKKIKGDNAKMMLGPCSGGSAPLSDGDGPLVICEGIETGLSLVQMLADRHPRVWAALSTSGIRGLKLPDNPGELILASDGDEPGRDAAVALANRAAGLGWNPSMLYPGDGLDWNDVLMDGSAAA